MGAGNYPEGNVYFDFSEITLFSEDMEYKGENCNEFTKQWFKQWANELLDIAKKRTPIRTGELANSWDPVDVSLKGNDLVIVFSNHCQYANYVEYGHAKPYKAGAEVGSEDWVTGSYMLTIPIQQFFKDLPANYGKAFYAYLKQKSK